MALSPERAERLDVATAHGSVKTMGRVPGRKGVDCSGYLMLPGLINAHDHLEFNLFPRLGNGPYESASAWARDIHNRFRETIQEALEVPLRERLVWGGIKNLISGVTTVCHHNPWNEVFDGRFPVRAVRALGWAHSLEFSADLRERYVSCPANRPFIFHAGEATNGAGKREMHILAGLGLFAANSVMVHAVGLDRESLALARVRGCSVVWCPSSNLFTLGKTLSRSVLKSDLPIALGTDSALTAEGDMIDELRVARQICGMSEARLYRMTTDAAARVLRLSHGEGAIQAGGVADLLLFRDRGLTPAQTLLSQVPEAALVGGVPQMVSADLATAWRTSLRQLSRFHRVTIRGRGTMYLRLKTPPIREGLSLAGRLVAA